MSQNTSVVSIEGGMLQHRSEFFKLYTGVVDLRAAYHLPLYKAFSGGISFNAGFLNYKNTPARVNILRPKLNLALALNVSPRITIDPAIGVGYSFLRITNNEYGYAKSQMGINYACNLKIRWKSESKIDYYIFGNYDYIFLDRDEAFSVLDVFRQIQLFSFGVGINIKSGHYE